MASVGGYALFETAFGVCGIAWGERGLLRFLLPGESAEATEAKLKSANVGGRMKPPAEVDKIIGDVRAYFDGSEIDFRGVPVDIAAAPELERRAYEALRKIGWGETTTYGEIAKAVGEPGAARAVGRAMAKNPLPLIVPCHRVLAAGGRTGGFSAPGGVTTKQKMLALERVVLAL